MRLIRTLSMSSLAAALVITSLAASAAAADPTKGKMTIVQGNYGVRVDVCINGREIKSRMPFGAKIHRTFGAGPKVLKVTKAAPGACTGKKLAKRVIKFPKGSDFTVVISKRKPKKVMVFDNASQLPPGPVLPGLNLFFRHAADIGKVTFRQEVRNLPLEPAPADPTWVKGDQTWRYLPIAVGGTPLYATTWVTRDLGYYPPARVAGPAWTLLGAYQRYEWILIGTGKHPRLIQIRRNY